MIASEKVQEVAGKLRKLNSEEKRQLFTLVPSLWESLTVETLRNLFSKEEYVIRREGEYRLDKKKQTRLSHLLEKNRSGMLTTIEEEEMEQLVSEAEELTLFKAQALYSLKLLEKHLLQNVQEKS